MGYNTGLESYLRAFGAICPFVVGCGLGSFLHPDLYTERGRGVTLKNGTFIMKVKNIGSAPILFNDFKALSRVCGWAQGCNLVWLASILPRSGGNLNLFPYNSLVAAAAA